MKNDDKQSWEQIRRRIDSALVAIEGGQEPSPDEEKCRLKERAHELSREPVIPALPSEFIEIVEFELATERYGLELRYVREVSILRDVTSVPCTPAFIVGIVNLRGEIRTIIDLRDFFGLPATAITDLNKAIFIHHDGMELGILTDLIRGVRTVLLNELQSNLPTLTGRRADYLRGVTNEPLIVLDARKILSDPSIIVNDTVKL